MVTEKEYAEQIQQLDFLSLNEHIACPNCGAVLSTGAPPDEAYLDRGYKAVDVYECDACGMLVEIAQYYAQTVKVVSFNTSFMHEG